MLYRFEIYNRIYDVLKLISLSFLKKIKRCIDYNIKFESEVK